LSASPPGTSIADSDMAAQTIRMFSPRKFGAGAHRD
jgi:hypothetical protein